MRIKRLLRALCSARLSDNSYLAIGGVVALFAMAIPLVGPAMAAVIYSVFVIIAAALVLKILLMSIVLL